jgi:hypothetical protein
MTHDEVSRSSRLMGILFFSRSVNTMADNVRNEALHRKVRRLYNTTHNLLSIYDGGNRRPETTGYRDLKK